MSSTPGWTRTTGQWLKKTVPYAEYQALTESSDVRVTIFCPGLSRNADLSTNLLGGSLQERCFS